MIQYHEDKPEELRDLKCLFMYWGFNNDWTVTYVLIGKQMYVYV